jgi:hypothetical protein
MRPLDRDAPIMRIDPPGGNQSDSRADYLGETTDLWRARNMGRIPLEHFPEPLTKRVDRPAARFEILGPQQHSPFVLGLRYDTGCRAKGQLGESGGSRGTHPTGSRVARFLRWFESNAILTRRSGVAVPIKRIHVYPASESKAAKLTT